MRVALIVGMSMIAFWTADVTAQTQPQKPAAAGGGDNVLSTANDAFGERVGIEQVGLYSETLSRGFSLANTGAYRIDGAYFAPTNGLVDPLIGGVSIRLGASAARLDFPSPSGVVYYRLRTAPPGEQLTLNIGDRHFGSFFAELNGSIASSDGQLGISGGALVQPEIDRPDGGGGSVYYGGLTPFWQPSQKLRIRALAGYRQGKFQGNYVYTVSADALASKPPERIFFAPQWTQGNQTDETLGVIVDVAPAQNWQISGSAFFAESDVDISDLTVLNVQPDRSSAIATLIRLPDRKTSSLSSELRATAQFSTGKVAHSLGAAVRNRTSRTRTAAGQSFNLGQIDLDDPQFGPELPLADDPRRTKDSVDQLSASINHSARFGERLELRSGVHLTRYAKDVRSLTGEDSVREEYRWLFNLSGIYSLNDRLSLFASYVRGLEEAGVAPQNAANRGEVLPPVVAEQYELGARYKLSDALSLIGAAFDISKPTPGLDPDGNYTFIGQVRHRGLELSLNGKIGPTTSIVAGGVAMNPTVSGELVDLGRTGSRAAGVSSVIAFVSAEQQLPVPGLSIDGRVSYLGSRHANSLNTLKTPSYMLADLGGRYTFKLGKSQATLRGTVVNLLNNRVWVAGSSGTMGHIVPRFLRLNLSIPLL